LDKKEVNKRGNMNKRGSQFNKEEYKKICCQRGTGEKAKEESTQTTWDLGITSEFVTGSLI